VPAAPAYKPYCYQRDTHPLAVALETRFAHFERKMLANSAVHKWSAISVIFDKVN
jgi:hypothetical protein